MANSPDLDAGFCVRWKTRRPVSETPCRSSTFHLMGSEWYLQLKVDGSWYPYGFSNEISLHRVTKSENLYFFVTTFIEDEKGNGMARNDEIAYVKSAEQSLWIFQKPKVTYLLPWYEKDAKFIIGCLFHGVSSSTLQTKRETIHVSTQYDLPSPASPSVATGLESLSVDLRNMLEDEAFSDVKLRCGDLTISAHRFVLAARSEVFAAMFRSKMTESESGIIDLIDMDPQVLDLFLKCVYSGKILDLSEDNACSLYTAGDKYAVHALKKECSAWMLSNLTVENVLNFLIMADTHSDKDLTDALVNFSVENLEVLNTESWSLFNKEHSELANKVYQKCFEVKLFKQGSQPK